jgi:hypothetical protein
MNEQPCENRQSHERGDVEQRLHAYYGPPLPDQPLDPAAWHQLRQRLVSPVSDRRRCRGRWRLPHQRRRASVPRELQQALARIAEAADVPAPPSLLRCTFQPRGQEPRLRGWWLGRRAIRLRLPFDAGTTLGRTELEVLLATGLARSLHARTRAPLLGRLSLAGMGLLAGLILIVCWLSQLPLMGVLIALALGVLTVWGWQRQTRAVVFHADTLVVRWLGRGQVCRGLHALAERSRRPQKRRWGEPSLSERIERVCGTSVEARDDQLTLVG